MFKKPTFWIFSSIFVIIFLCLICFFVLFLTNYQHKPQPEKENTLDYETIAKEVLTYELTQDSRFVVYTTRKNDQVNIYKYEISTGNLSNLYSGDIPEFATIEENVGQYGNIYIEAGDYFLIIDTQNWSIDKFEIKTASDITAREIIYLDSDTQELVDKFCADLTKNSSGIVKTENYFLFYTNTNTAISYELCSEISSDLVTKTEYFTSNYNFVEDIGKKFSFPDEDIEIEIKEYGMCLDNCNYLTWIDWNDGFVEIDGYPTVPNSTFVLGEDNSIYLMVDYNLIKISK